MHIVDGIFSIIYCILLSVDVRAFSWNKWTLKIYILGKGIVYVSETVYLFQDKTDGWPIPVLTPAAARSYSLRLYKAFVWRMPPAASHQRRPSLPCSPRSSLVHRTTIAPASHLHRSFIALPSHLHHTFIARTLHSHYTYSLRTAHVVRTYFYV